MHIWILHHFELHLGSGLRVASGTYILMYERISGAGYLVLPLLGTGDTGVVSTVLPFPEAGLGNFAPQSAPYPFHLFHIKS